MDKIVIALNIIVDFVDNQTNINEKDITDYLYQTGFDEYEIRQAMSLLDVDTYTGTFSLRIFTEHEKKKLSKNTIFFLQKLTLSGILDMISLEDIILIALDSDAYKVDVEHIKHITLTYLLEKKTIIYEHIDNSEDYTH